MAIIRLQTEINAPRARVFDLARSIDAHQFSTEETNEVAVAGVTAGLIGMGEEVTWEARHFDARQRLTVRVTQFDRPNHFQDEMVKGAFRRMVHDHAFEDQGSRTLMRDRFEFDAPLGIFGVIAERLFLVRYMTRFIKERNAVLKRVAESDEWKKFLRADGESDSL